VVEQIEHPSRDTPVTRAIDVLRGDTRHAFRRLGRDRRFTAAVL
jgi:hypothetical protein